MKKILAILVTIIFMMGLCSCGSPSPTEVTQTFLEGIKAQDMDAINSAYANGKLDLPNDLSLENPSEDELEEQDEVDEIMNETVMPKLVDFDYELGEEKVTDGKATVEVKFKTYSFGDALNGVMEDYVSQAFPLAFGGASDKQLEDLLIGILKTNFDNVEKDYEKTVTVPLTQKDGKWVIDAFDEDSDFIDALTGGMLDASNSLSEAYDF